MSESTKDDSAMNAPQGEGKRIEGQATLSAIGDVSIAATDTVSPTGAPGKTRCLPILGFLFLSYIAGSLAAIYAHQSQPWVQVFVAPLVLVLIATLTFWRRQVWKFRARDAKYRAKAKEDSLNSVAHETANGLNALRANLAGMSESNSLPSAGEHRKQVDEALARMEAVLTKAIGEAQPKQASGSKPASEAARSKAA